MDASRVPRKELQGIIPHSADEPSDLSILEFDKQPGQLPTDLHMDAVSKSVACETYCEDALIPGKVVMDAENFKLNKYWKRMVASGMDPAQIPRFVPLAMESGGRMGDHWLAFLGELARSCGKKHIRRIWIQQITSAFHLKAADLILTACALAHKTTPNFIEPEL